ncbi:hypothetical protein [Roseimicrobium sp. ORNL1]|uniref:hypothetical protein n=1 Tax=Roseimicrobium sp. ORNL1 TaxID=2711231 RepID=UPI0013E2059A|nr:hypothetical protein [Roseimicrobium sp. ORNL1]QIF00243.1 hypothetical protein G5S37_01455 [Roseimicrobium sp. ORNL1]
MKAFKRIGIALAILAALLTAYLAFYWMVNHSKWGMEFYNSEEGVYKWYPEWLHDAQNKLLAPAKRLEHWAGEEKQRRHIVGEWLSENPKCRAVIDENYHVTLWGLAKDGIPDGSSHATTFQHCGVAKAYLMFGEHTGSTVYARVYVNGDEPSLLNITIDKRPSMLILRKQQKAHTP